MKRLLVFLLLISAAYGAVENVTVDSLTRHILNSGTVNFAPNQLLVNGIAVVGGAGGGPGPGPGVTSLKLNVPSDLFATPILFDLSTSDWVGTMTKANAPGTTVYGNTSGAAGPPGFFTFSVLKSSMALDLVENTKLSTWPGSTNITTLGTVTSGSFPAANLSGTIGTAKLADASVTYAKIQNVAAGKMLGNPTGSAAPVSEISIGSGLSLSTGGTLTATGGGGGGTGNVISDITSSTVGQLTLFNSSDGVHVKNTAITGIPKLNVGVLTQAVANQDYDLVSVGAFDDTGSDTTPSLWSNTSGVYKTTMVESVPLTANRYRTLPSYLVFRPGQVITYIDFSTTGNFGGIFRPAAGEALNGELASSWSNATLHPLKGFQPFIAGGLSPLGRNYEFINVSGGWQSYYGNMNATSIQDPSDAGKQVLFDVSGQPSSTTTHNVLRPAISGDSVTAVPYPRVTGQWLNGFSSSGTTPTPDATGVFTSGPVHVYDLQLTQADIDGNTPITSNTATVTADGTIDNIKLSATLTAPLTIIWPPAGAYGPGESVRFYDPSGSISSTNTVTINNTTDTFNIAGAPAGDHITITDPGAVRTAFADPISNSWTFTAPGTTAAPSGFATAPLTEDTTAHTLTWNAVAGATVQTAIATATGNDKLVINGAQAGMTFVLSFIQGGAGNFTLALPDGSRTPSDGKGLIAVSPAAGAVTKLVGTYYGASGLVYVWDSSLNYTAAVPVGCGSTLGDTYPNTGWSGTASQAFGNASNATYYATLYNFSGANTSVCRIDAPIWKSGTPGPADSVTAYIYTDNGAPSPGTVIATSASVPSSAITATNATTAQSAPTTFTFPSTTTLVSSTSYWIVLKAGAISSTNYYNWVDVTGTGGFPGKKSQDGTTWTTPGINQRLFFKTYH